jgi:predicted GTPase
MADNSIFDDDLRINMVVIGPVSAGKSTFINSLFVQQYSDMKIKRTTAVPQVYNEVETLNKTQTEELLNIRDKNRNINESIMKKSQKGEKITDDDIKEVRYCVPKIFDFVKLEKKVLMSVYDLPGLNDSMSDDSSPYYNYVKKNFYKFDIIVLILDINSAMNTVDEKKILTVIIDGVKENKRKHDINTELIILLNKCDEMTINNQNKLMPSDEEYVEMYNQANDIINNTIKESKYEINYNIIPISCEDSFIYRMCKRNPNAKLDIKHINKFGANEYGKKRWSCLSEEKKISQIKKVFSNFDYVNRIEQCGFKQLQDLFGQILSEKNQYQYLLNHIKYDLSQINNYTVCDATLEIGRFNKCNDKYKFLCTMFGYEPDEKFTQKYLDEFMNKYYDSNIKPIITEKVKDNTFSVMKNIQKVYKNIQYFFSKLFDKYVETYHKVINNINDYYIELINDKKCPIGNIFEHINSLKNNNFVIDRLVVNTFSNLYNYEETNNKDSKCLLDVLKYAETLYSIEYNDMLHILLSILDHYYYKLWEKISKEYSDSELLWILYLIKSKYFFDNIKLNSVKYFKFSIFKEKLNKIVLDSIILIKQNNIHQLDDLGKNIRLNIEEYVVELIKTHDPTNICSLDELMTFYHQNKFDNAGSLTKSLKFSNSNKKEVDNIKESGKQMKPLKLPSSNKKKHSKIEDEIDLSDELDDELELTKPSKKISKHSIDKSKTS